RHSVSPLCPYTTLFRSGDNGLMARLGSKIDPFTQSGGILDSRTKALQNTLSSVDDQREALDLRIGKVEARLLKQFNAMDSLLGQDRKSTRLNSSHVKIS